VQGGALGVYVAIELLMVCHCAEGVFKGANELWMLANKASKLMHSGDGVMTCSIMVVSIVWANAFLGWASAVVHGGSLCKHWKMLQPFLWQFQYQHCSGGLGEHCQLNCFQFLPQFYLGKRLDVGCLGEGGLPLMVATFMVWSMEVGVSSHVKMCRIMYYIA